MSIHLLQGTDKVKVSIKVQLDKPIIYWSYLQALAQGKGILTGEWMTQRQLYRPKICVIMDDNS